MTGGLISWNATFFSYVLNVLALLRLLHTAKKAVRRSAQLHSIKPKQRSRASTLSRLRIKRSIPANIACVNVFLQCPSY